MPYVLDINPSQSEVSEAVNYLLSNFSQGLTSNPNTGEITGPSGEVLGYLYQYIAVKYADSQDGSVNFSNVATNRLYYGIRNTNDSVESTNPVDYIWNLVTGGFGTTKFLWYSVTGGRQIQFAVSTLTYNVGYVLELGVSIDLDIITSSLTSDSFGTTFSPSTLQVPYTNAPVFTSVIARLYGTNAYGIVDFVVSQTDTDVAFVNNTWRIGDSATTGYASIVKTGITIGNPTDGGSFALWPIPTAMTVNSATMAVPIRYKDNAGTIRQAALSTLQFVFNYSGKNSTICYALYNGNPTVTGASITTAGTNVPSTTSFSPTSATAFTYAVQTPGPSQAMFQCDGIYDPVANTTNWNTPYLSNLKVGQLSAITADLGTINAGIVNGVTFYGGSASSYGTGTGWFAGIDSGTYKFRFGNPSGNNVSWDGTNLNITGGGTFSGTLTAAAVNAVNTINIAGNAVTTTTSSSGIGTTATNITIPSGVTAKITAIVVCLPNENANETESRHDVVFNGVTFNFPIISINYEIGGSGTFSNYFANSTFSQVITITGPATISCSSTNRYTSSELLTSAAQSVILLATFR